MNNTSLIYIPIIKPKAIIRLICFPYAGGNSSTYISWQHHLNPNIELAVVQLPGRGIRLTDTPYQTMEEMIKALFFSLEKLSNKPFIFYGHSMGARVAYELTLMLHRFRYRLPIHFIASGSNAPCIPRTKDLIYDLPDNQFLEEVAALNNSANEVHSNDEILQLMLPALRADFKIIETYCNRSTLVIPTKISVLAGNKDEDVTNTNIEAWLNLFSSNTGIHWISGDHFFVDTNKIEVLEMLDKLLRDHFAIKI